MATEWTSTEAEADCPACSGTGRNWRGGTCGFCDGDARVLYTTDGETARNFRPISNSTAPAPKPTKQGVFADRARAVKARKLADFVMGHDVDVPATTSGRNAVCRMAGTRPASDKTWAAVAVLVNREKVA